MNLLPMPPAAKLLYDALGIPDTATADEIRAGFRRIAQQHHPDHNAGRVNEIYAKAQHAYKVLSDPGMKAAYDLDGVDPGGRIKSLERVAMELIVNAAFQCIDERGGEGNLLELMREFLRRDVQQTELELRRVDAVLARSGKARKNIEDRWKGAEAPRSAVLAMIDEQRSKNSATRVLAQQKLDFLTMALEILEPATYENVGQTLRGFSATIGGQPVPGMWSVSYK